MLRPARAGRAASIPLSLGVLAFAALAAAPAQAQTETTLVRVSGIVNIALATGHLDGAAQGFTTGGAAQGYTLTSIRLRLAVVPSPLPDTAAVKIRRGGRDGTVVATLSNPTSFTGDAFHTFTAPANTSLARNTTYWVTVNDDTGEGGVSIQLSSFVLSGSVVSGLRGWSMGNAYDREMGTSTWSEREDGVRLLMEVRGTVTGGNSDTTLKKLGLTAGGSAVSLTPAFNKNTLRYTALVDEGVSSVTVTVETTESRARVEIAGDDGATKTLSVPLGRSEIQVRVTASDEVRQGFYRVTVGRGGSDATLASLGVSDGGNAVSLTPAFVSDTTDYRARVAQSVSRVTVAGTPSDNDASVRIQRDDDTSTPNSATLGLERGANSFKVIVVAQNGFTFKTYEVQVIREGPPPRLVSATVWGDELNLGYDTRLRPDGRDNLLAPPASAYTVMVEGAPVSVTGTAINSKFVVLTLARAVTHRERGVTVTVSYTPPPLPDDAVQTTLGGRAAALTDRAVNVLTPPSGPGTGGVQGKQLLYTKMTVGHEIDEGYFGYDDGRRTFSAYGSLGRTQFPFNGESYTVEALALEPGFQTSLNLDLSGTLTQEDAANLALYVGGTRVHFPGVARDQPSLNHRIWTIPDPTWADGQIVPVLIVDENRAPVFNLKDAAGGKRFMSQGVSGARKLQTPVTATDPDGHTVTYALDGPDADQFNIDAATGQLFTRGDVIYGNEAGVPYRVAVRASDPYGASRTLDITIVNRFDPGGSTPPPIPGAPAGEPFVLFWYSTFQAEEQSGREGLYDNRDFTHGGVEYEVEELTVNASGSLVLKVDTALPDGLDLSLYNTARYRGWSFSTADASATNSGKTLTWNNTGVVMDADDNASIQVDLTSFRPTSVVPPTIAAVEGVEGDDQVLDVSWEAPVNLRSGYGNRGWRNVHNLVGYEVRAENRRQTDGQIRRVIADARARSARVSGMTQNAAYDVRVRPLFAKCAACADNRAGAWSATITKRPGQFRPEPRAATVPSDGRSVVLTFDDALARNRLPDRNAFTVRVDGTAATLGSSLRKGAHENQIELPVTSQEIKHGQAVTVSYEGPTSGNVLEDRDGNAAAEFTDFAVTNNSNRAGPRLESASVVAAGNQIDLNFDGPLSASTAARPLASAFEVTVEITASRRNLPFPIGVGSVAVTGNTVSLGTLSRTIRGSVGKAVRMVRVRYTDPSPGNDPAAIQDADSTDTVSFVTGEIGGVEVVNASTVTAAGSGIGPEPIALFVVTSGIGVTIEFDENIIASTLPVSGAFRVTANGSPLTIGTPSSTGRIVYLGVTPTVKKRQTVVVSYIKPASGNVLEDSDGNDAAPFSDLPGVNESTQAPLSAPPAPLTAEFRDVSVESHDGSTAFTLELGFSEEFPISAETLRDSALAVPGGAVTAVERTEEGKDRNWRITVTPSTQGTVTIALAPTESCEDDGAICTEGGRSIAEAIEIDIEGPATAATRVTSASITSEPGPNGTWDTGEVVTAQVVFSAQVTVNGPPNVGPTLAILLDGTRREAAYTGGSGTDTLTFSHTVTAADDGARRARVASNGLSLNGVVLGDTRGLEAEIGFSVAPWVTAVALVPDASGDRSWTSGETLEVRLTVSEAVTVAGGPPTVGVTIAGEAATLDYASGSGSAVLSFSRAVTDADGSLSQIAVTADSLALAGATMVSDASGLAAELAHDGTAETEPVSLQGRVALGAALLDVPADGHGGAAFTLTLQFSEEFPLSYRSLQNPRLTAAGGTLTTVSRVTEGENREWNLAIEPEGSADVTVTLAATADCEEDQAICNADQVPLSAAVSVTVAAESTMAGSSSTLTVADAEEREGPNAVLRFPVTLTPASAGEVTVAYATADGTATAGSDYTATSGTLSFEPGETSKTIAVPITDDGVDDGGETFTLTLSSASGADLDDAEATGTIQNRETPLTASFEDVPSEHDGSTAFTFRLRFSEPVNVGYATLKEYSFQVSTATIKKAQRVDGRDDLRKFTVEPSSDTAVVLVLPATDDCTALGAICTSDGKRLSTRLEITVPGPAPANSAATGTPAISGTPEAGQPLTASTSGISDADGLTNATFGYQWIANDGTSDTDITGATNADYTLADADEGKTVKVQVSFTDDANNQETLTSAATDAVAAATQPNNPATGAPTISGTAQVGETLTADTTGIADEDGLNGVTFSHQWVANDGTADTDITGATGSTFTLAADDEGKTIKVRVSFADDAGHEEALTSAATEAVAAAPQPNSPATGAPTVSGTAQVGETLTADTSGIADENGLENVTFTYQWLADNAAIAGATGSTHTLADADEGKAITVQVSFTDDAGNDEMLTSAATAAVSAAPTPNSPATGAPAINGAAQVGKTLTADTSGISDADGLTSVSYSYQWLAGDSDISGATNATYTLVAADEGKAIKVRVSFTDDAGNEETLTSAATAVVKAPLTASLENTPDTHDGENVFTFELRFSEEFSLSYKTLRDHAFTVSGGEVEKAERITKGSNLRWLITVRPDGDGQVTITLPATTDCDAEGAICTGDGRMLSNELVLTVSGPGQ